LRQTLLPLLERRKISRLQQYTGQFGYECAIFFAGGFAFNPLGVSSEGIPGSVQSFFVWERSM
jgi:hypothetical protein